MYSKQSSDRSAGRVQGLILARGAAAGIAALGLQAVWAAVDDPLVGNLIDAGGTLTLAVNLGVPFGVIRAINRAPARRNTNPAERERAQREGLACLNHLLRDHILKG